MVFDRNHEIFNSEAQKHFWNSGRNLIPLDISLADITDDEFKECCIQLYQYTFDVYCDAFNNAELYSQYNSVSLMSGIREMICNGGASLSDANFLVFYAEKYSKLYEKVIEDSEKFKILERQGIFFEMTADGIIVSSRKYPKALNALFKMLHVKATCLKYDYQRVTACLRCDFRILKKALL